MKLRKGENAESVGKFQPKARGVPQPARCFETLKALANFSPGFALKPWVIVVGNKFFATLKGLRRPLRFPDLRRNPFRVATTSKHILIPRVAKAQPWAEISQRFQR